MGSGKISKNISEILQELGQDPNSANLRDTPERVAQSLNVLTSGYEEKLMSISDYALFEAQYNEMVVVLNIEFYSMCEHHLLPFFGRCHVAYIPNKKIIGISKIPQIIDMFARRLQLQENLTKEIGESLDRCLQPKGCAIIMEAQHLCMMMRGVQKQNSFITTQYKSKDFKNEKEFQTFYSQIRT